MSVFVVPDDAIPKQGRTAARPEWEQNLGAFVTAIRRHKDPPFQPFPEGTPTLRAREVELDEAYRRDALQERRRTADRAHEIDRMREGRLAASDSATTGVAGKTATERRNAASANLLRSAQGFATRVGKAPDSWRDVGVAATSEALPAGERLRYVLDFLSDSRTQGAAKELGADVDWVVDQIVRQHTGKGLDRYLADTPSEQLHPYLQDIRARRERNRNQSSLEQILPRLTQGTQELP